MNLRIFIWIKGEKHNVKNKMYAKLYKFMADLILAFASCRPRNKNDVQVSAEKYKKYI